jgi:hypothetical protein
MKSALLVLTATIAAHASTIAYLDPATPGSQQWAGNLALLFHVNLPITITSLGVFNASGTGIVVGTVLVNIWNTGTNTPVTPTASFHGNFTPAGAGFDVFQAITPITLTVGNYEVDTVGWSANDPNGNRQLGSSGPILNDGGGLITFTGAAFDFSPTLDGPTSCQGCLAPQAQFNNFDAGTFVFQASAAPEPGAFVAAGLGLIALSIRARRARLGRRVSE